MIKKFNPLWIPFFTFWIPSQIAKIPMANETVKTVIIWCIIVAQAYFLYQGINYIKYKNQAGESDARGKKTKDSGRAKK